MNKRGFQLDTRDKKKSEWELANDIEELKKRKNKDVEDIKILKVELNKLESLYKKFKENYSVNTNAFSNIATNTNTHNNGSLLSILVSGGGNDVIDTELLLIEIARIKN
jgi:hypothetical protein